VKTEVFSIPQYEVIPGTTYQRLINFVSAYSKVLKRFIDIKAGFICDVESTPWRGEDSIAGLIHDWASRNGSGVDSKILAAKVYYEFQKWEDDRRDTIEVRPWYVKSWDCGWRFIKAGFVAVCPNFVYWKKHTINAGIEEFI